MLSLRFGCGCYVYHKKIQYIVYQKPRNNSWVHGICRKPGRCNIVLGILLWGCNMLFVLKKIWSADIVQNTWIHEYICVLWILSLFLHLDLCYGYVLLLPMSVQLSGYGGQTLVLIVTSYVKWKLMLSDLDMVDVYTLACRNWCI